MIKRATRQDVAAAAGVSGATVSRVYNNPGLVDKATVDRVRRAADELGFVPDRHAAALRRGQSSTILFVEIDRPLTYRWPSQRAYQSLYGEIVRAVLHSGQTGDTSLQLVSLTSAAEIAALPRRGDFAGILGFDITDQGLADALAALGRPVVCAHHGDHLTGVSTVTTDNRAGGALQAAWLRGRGPAAYITGLRHEEWSHQGRWEGFSAAAPEARLVDGVVGFAEGTRAGRELAAEVKAGRLRSFACVNDLTALGLIQGLASGGVLVPRDAEVIGYDNLVLTELVGGGLPTVEARLPEVYTRALAVLKGLIGGRGSEGHEVVEPLLTTPSLTD